MRRRRGDLVFNAIFAAVIIGGICLMAMACTSEDERVLRYEASLREIDAVLADLDAGTLRLELAAVKCRLVLIEIRLEGVERRLREFEEVTE